MDKSTQSVVSRSRPPTTSPPAPVPARVDASRLDDRGQKRTSESQIHPPPVKRFAPNAYELPTVAEPDSTARLPSPRSAPPLVGTSGNFMFSSGAAPTSSIPTRYVTTAPGHWGELVSRQAPITQATPFPSQSIAQKTTGRDFVPNNNFYNGSFAGSSMSTTNRSQISSAPAHQQSMGNIYSMPQFRHMSFNSAAPQQQSSGGPPPLRYGPPPNAHMRPAEGFSQSAYMLNLLNQQMQQRNPAFHMNNLMGQMNGTGDFEPLEMELQKFMHGCLPSGPK